MTKGKQCGYGYKQSIEELEDNASFMTEHLFFSLIIIACIFVLLLFLR